MEGLGGEGKKLYGRTGIYSELSWEILRLLLLRPRKASEICEILGDRWERNAIHQALYRLRRVKGIIGRDGWGYYYVVSAHVEELSRVLLIQMNPSEYIKGLTNAYGYLRESRESVSLLTNSSTVSSNIEEVKRSRSFFTLLFEAVKAEAERRLERPLDGGEELALGTLVYHYWKTGQSWLYDMDFHDAYHSYLKAVRGDVVVVTPIEEVMQGVRTLHSYGICYKYYGRPKRIGINKKLIKNIEEKLVGTLLNAQRVQGADQAGAVPAHRGPSPGRDTGLPLQQEPAERKP